MNKELSLESRLWLYPADRNLNDTEIKSISERLEKFCSEWTAHDQALKADYEIRDKRFIVLAVDESRAGASGCSIDKSVKVLKELGASLNLDFFGHGMIYFKNADEIGSVHFSELQKAYDEGILGPQSLFYNTQFKNLDEFNTQLTLPFESHWVFGRLKHKING